MMLEQDQQQQQQQRDQADQALREKYEKCTNKRKPETTIKFTGQQQHQKLM